MRRRRTATLRAPFERANPWLLLGVLVLSGCAALDTTPPAIVHQPMTARPAPQSAPPNNGAIYQASAVRPLFEDRKPRYVGDTLTINLVENTSARKNTGANASRNTNSEAGISGMTRLPLSGLAGLSLNAGSDQSLEAKGGASADNRFQGTITVTVIDVYPNGNLLVSGEKQLAINQGREYIRFSGVVDPVTISGRNSVESTAVADARIEYVGSGYIDEAQRMGWLQRFFLNFLPF
ncbi:flagellar basal body L-ring protein FlgH [Tepidiphilus baoligensis]|uniref:Flagellar L-ring protein n=1 Tax=Tepidiphilus baoligensis TaxID=2698687 RepID=A0ABX1QNA2_9PROT|nr:flagellar basal body L-ring protein FlgH [Tepidiphilus baoligensis]NMH16633.1 flagellar biosynthesis protein FlgH [Tepidiphilus baoligensis]